MNDSAIISSNQASPFCFESYGVKIMLKGNDQSLIDDAAQTARKALLGNVKEIRSRSFHHEFQILKKGKARYKMIHQDLDSGWSISKRLLLRYFDSILRVSVGEYAVDRVFLHSGAVAWKGKAILLPADSFKGKSTLVSELVKLGAEYYSDEFAVLDPDGMLHPYSRPISMRSDDGKYRTFELTVEQLKGTYGVKPIPVGTVILTEHVRGRKWRAPKTISPGAAMLAIIPFSLSIRKQPDLTMSVLKKVGETAFVAKGKRGEAGEYARHLLKFIEERSSGDFGPQST